MNFPDNAFFAFIYWLVNTPGIGGFIVSILGLGILLSVGLTLRWIIQGDLESEPEEFSYPTPALHSHEPDA